MRAQTAYINSSFCDYSQITKAALFQKQTSNKHQTAGVSVRLWQLLALKATNTTELELPQNS